ncbi:RHS repeat-associated core domain-containing protein [Pseudomonas sp. PSKL.D1]|uniref:RHS repeat-associated core domain-containing protein n=1 Tax=Pseudomonas sp. PSKL.D1 TaxID=3029060 RepID=UPI0023817C6F|nr:RHS repeat-associated core domain-containing protein [Pseudomonas sp. PSKL.D1]WDY57004.1 RHS domain-containing protein [Pseudomonas sp. PSKL.D1]
MFEAARLHDEIEHSGALAGFLVGAVIGLAIVTAATFTLCTAGFGGILLAAVIGIGASALPMLGESLGMKNRSPAGQIERIGCSPNVFINGRNAAHATLSTAKCEQHPIPLVAEGSSNVFINGVPAARKGDKLTCGASIASGSSNVFIGGGTQRYLSVDDEVPQPLRITVDILMVVASLGRSVWSVGQLAKQAGLKAAGPCALQVGATIAASYLAGRYIIGPAVERAMGGLLGNPVDLTRGRKLLANETDFVLPGLMPIEWSRFYASDLTAPSVLGQGWILPWEQTLRRSGSFVYHTDNQGRSVPFIDLQPGESIYNPHERIHLVRTQGGHYLLQTLDNVFFYFGEVPANNTAVPLQRVENALGHYLHFTRDAENRLTDITAPGAVRVHLHYDHPLGRLTEVKRVVADHAVETLVRYRYDEHGQLNEVINRNGNAVRQFAYTDQLMTRHTNALGLICEYRWETLAGQPRVVEHWTSDGERYHFSYDFEQRSSWATDVLGRVLHVQYNEDHRVIASQDFGGEHYAMTLDATGNLVGIQLPDGNLLALKYDELSRLVEETDPLGRSIRYQYHRGTPLISETRFPDGSVWQARYDAQGNLITEIDPLGNKTQYLNRDDGLPHTVIDSNFKSRYLWWNAYAQVERFEDCSGKRTHYQYDDRHHLVAVTDALNHTTTLQRKPDGEVLRIDHPDGTAEAFTYNALGQVLTHTDGKGQTTRLQRTSRGLPGSRQDANGEWVRYEYDHAQRLTALVNENHATYRFAYDASDRLTEEIRVDNLTRRFSYDVAGQLTRLDEVGCGDQGERPERSTLFERDAIGRLLAKVTDDARLDFEYDPADRLLSIQREPTNTARKRGVTREKLEYAYDIMGRLTEEIAPNGTLKYAYDRLGNLTTLTLPDGRALNHLYYGSGHLHQLNLDGQVISDFERDDLHREVYRTQGKLTSCFGYDAMGRKAWQYATTLPAEKLSQIQNPGIHPSLYVEHAYNPIHRRYQYDAAGELARTLDKLRGETRYTYQANGRLHSKHTGSLLDSEEFRYDPAANRLDFDARPLAKVKDNRLRELRNQQYRYDPWGNLIEKGDGRGSFTKLEYDCENRLTRSDRYVEGRWESSGVYRYDSLGRRVAKEVERRGQTEGQPEQKHFLWHGLRMLREETPGQSILYLYEPGSYAPLARVDQAEGDERKVYYFHTDQIGTPLELTDSEGVIVWQAKYRSWGQLEQLVVEEVEQNLRFQGQYHDADTGLHYNTFRYYDPEVGRFVTQDPIGLSGGENFYSYAPNSNGWLDPLGWCVSTNVTRGPAGQPLRATATITQADLRTGTATNASSRAWARMMGNPDDDAGHIIGKLLGGSGGTYGVFPQFSKVNRGLFRDFERQIAKDVFEKGPVNVELIFQYGVGGTRPTKISYNVFRDGGLVDGKVFRN